MSVYYKFKSARDYDSVSFDGHFISVGHLKEKIFELKHLGTGTDFDLVVTNAQTNEDYPDEGQLIPKNTSVLIRRVPGRSRRPLAAISATLEQDEFKVQKDTDAVEAINGSLAAPGSSAMQAGEDLESDLFGNDLYAIPEARAMLSIPVQNIPLLNKEDEESKFKALIETPALDWQQQSSDAFGPGRGFARGIGGRMVNGRGFGRGGFEKKTPPQGYVCHRCKVPGHFIQHCPTNGDPNFDIKRVKPPTGIPKSMLVPTPDGSYALPSGVVAVLKPNEAAFEKEIEGMPSTRPIGDLPPELHCPLCKQVMKDAVLTSKCCFTSFCDKCIRDQILSNFSCVCGATNVLADDLLPNKTLRDTINRILEFNNHSGENGGSAFLVQDMESRNPQAKVPSPTQSVASKGMEEPEAPKKNEDVLVITGTLGENKIIDGPSHPESFQAPGVRDISEGTHDSKNVKEVPQGSGPLADEEVQQKPVSGELGKKKKKKKARVVPGAAEMQWRGPMTQDHMYDNYMMPMAPTAFNPYWPGVQPGFDGYMPPYGGHMPYMGYGVNPMDVAFSGMPPYMLPYGPPPPRDHAEFPMGGFNGGPPPMSREEFEARKPDLKRKRENEMRAEKEQPKDRDHRREGSSTFDVPPRSKSKLPDRHSSKSDHHPRSSPPSTYRGHETPPRRKDRSPVDRDSRPSELPVSSSKADRERERGREHGRGPEPPSKKPSDHDRHRSHSRKQRRSESPPDNDKNHKGSVFSRISYPDYESRSNKEKKVSSSNDAAATARRSVDPHNNSDDERHFKRRQSESDRGTHSKRHR